MDALTVPAGAVITLDPGVLDKNVDNGRVLITFASGTVAGTFVLPPQLRPKWEVKVLDGVISLVRIPGTTVILR